MDPFQESFISYRHIIIVRKPDGIYESMENLVTHYVDKDYNVLLSTDDGEVMTWLWVPDEYVGDFTKICKFYSDQRLAPVYNSKGWNSYWKNKIRTCRASISELELAKSVIYTQVKDGKNKAMALAVSHQGSDLLAAGR